MVLPHHYICNVMLGALLFVLMFVIDPTLIIDAVPGVKMSEILHLNFPRKIIGCLPTSFAGVSLFSHCLYVISKPFRNPQEDAHRYLVLKNCVSVDSVKAGETNSLLLKMIIEILDFPVKNMVIFSTAS